MSASPDNTRVPPNVNFVDANANVWTMGLIGDPRKNGQATSGTGSVLLPWNSGTSVYLLGNNGYWYLYNASTNHFDSTGSMVDPTGGSPTPPPPTPPPTGAAVFSYAGRTVTINPDGTYKVA
jgi:hypothetical protein